MKNVNEIFKDVNLSKYAPIPFWSWNNKLDKEELVKQIRHMKSVGMGGFIMHARMGLTTPYLGEEWFDCIEACLDEAKALGMNGWIYDENGWPSGFVGGELLNDKENLATFLELETGEYSEDAYAVFLRDKGGFRRVKAPEGHAEYYNVFLRYSPANTDILKPSVVKQFIQLTYEKYYERFKDRFGKELVGFFTDEPQYFRWGTPYSVTLIDYFKQTYGEDVKDGLIHLFFDGEEDYSFRVRYYKAMNELYTVNYYKELYDWCVSHGCGFTGHSVEESYLFMQMWGGAGVMPSYEYETIPGIDNLSRNSMANLSARQVGSVSAQLGKKQILTETFGCAGYSTTPTQLRNIAEKQYVHGVNLMCHHLYSYSLSGQGKTDHPPCFSKHMPWEKSFKLFNDYFTKLGYLLAESKTSVNTAVLSPMSSIYLQYNRFNEAKARKIDDEMIAFQEEIGRENIEYHFIDEKLLEKYGKIEDGKLVLGECKYEYLVLPYCPNIYSSTYEFLKAYASSGGKIYMFKGTPKYVEGVQKDFSFIKTNTTYADMKEASAFRINGDGVEFTHRKIKDTSFTFILNQSEEEAEISFDKEYISVDLSSGEAVDMNGFATMAPYESLLLVKGVDSTQKAPYITQKQNITSSFTHVCSDDNTLPLDKIKISFDGKNYGEEKYVYETFYTLIEENYTGDLYVKYCFDVQDVLPMRILKEMNAGYDLKVNGQPVLFSPSQFDVKFEECDITPYLKKGENEFTYTIKFWQAPIVRYALFDPTATESVRNCLCFDTEIEQVYLKGNFAVNGRTITSPVSPNLRDIAGFGYKYFSGEMTFAGSFNCEKGKALLEIEGDHMCASAVVNGKVYPLVMKNCVEIETIDGENKIELKVISSLRNSIGPFHCIFNEDDGVSPYNFRMHDIYKAQDVSIYTQEYITVPFGVKKVTISY